MCSALSSKKELKKAARNQEITTNAGKYRFACIIAFIAPWKAAATPVNALASAKCTGIYPLDPTAPRNSVYVRDLTPEEQHRFEQREQRNANRFNINCKFLTDAGVIVEMANQVVLKTKFPHLCDIAAYSTMNYSSIIARFLEKASSFLLSPIPPLLSLTSPPKFFNRT